MHSRIAIIIIFVVFLPIQGMDCTIIQTSDGHVYSLPQHKIDYSRTFVQKQCLKQEYPICTTGDKTSLDLFFDAHEQPDFDSFFYALSPNQRTTLVNIAGEKQLNSPTLTLKLLSVKTIEPSITPHLKPFLSIDSIITYLTNLLITKTITRKTKKNYLTHKSKQFSRNYRVVFDTTYEQWAFEPKKIIHQKPYLFNAHISPKDTIKMHAQLDKKHFTLYSFKSGKNNTEYYLTANNPNSIKNQTSAQKKERILYVFHPDKTISSKIISHNNNITQTLFSPDGCYLMSYSAPTDNYFYPTVMIHSLESIDSFYPHIILPIQGNTHITQLSFSPESHWLIMGVKEYHNNNTITARLELWDPACGKLIKTINDVGKSINMILFNRNESRMLTTIYTENNEHQYALWNTQKLPEIKLIKKSFLLHDDAIAKYPEFNHAGTRLILPTKNGAVIFVNSLTGDIISTIHQKRFFNATTHSVFTPDDTLCLTATTKLSQKNNDSTCIWDAQSGSLLKTILGHQNNIRGIGFSHNLQYAITTFHGYKITSTQLIDDHSMNCLRWIQNHASLTQLYALYHLYKAHTQKRIPTSDILRLLEQFPTKPCNLKTFVKRYLVYHPSHNQRPTKKR